MTYSYFKQVPNFEYVNRTKGSQDISNFISVKNDLQIDDQLFKYGVRINADLIEDQDQVEEFYKMRESKYGIGSVFTLHFNHKVNSLS